MVINADDINMVENVAYFKHDTTLVSGVVRQWNDNGQLSSEKTYKDGKLDGVWKGWYSNGQLMSQGAYSNMISVMRFHLMTYIDLFKFLENPSKQWFELTSKLPEIQLKLF